MLVTLTTFDLWEKGKVNSEGDLAIVFKNYCQIKTRRGAVWINKALVLISLHLTKFYAKGESIWRKTNLWHIR